MPTLVETLFKENGKEILGQTRWGCQINCNSPGVYVVAITPIASEMLCYNEAPISNSIVEEWLNRVPRMTIDNTFPTPELLVERLKSFWIPDETILYIGKAGTSLHNRINQYYNTKLGNRSPHRGGHWIKTLENLDQLNIYWTTSDHIPAKDLEYEFLSIFVQNVLPSTKIELFDPNHPYPFANLEFPQGTRKIHGLNNQVNN